MGLPLLIRSSLTNTGNPLSNTIASAIKGVNGVINKSPAKAPNISKNLFIRYNSNMGKLLYFYGDECDHCHAMRPLIERLEKESGAKIEQYEVWHNEKNAKIMDGYDKNCGGVPFFYNTESKEWLCGEVSFEKLKEWALSR